MPLRASKHDPLRVFKFRVRLDEETVAGVTKVSALGRSVAANEIKEGGDLLAPYQNPGAVTYDDITLEWGLAITEVIENWANDVVRVHTDPKVKNFKKTVYIDVYNLDGNPAERSSKPALSYKIHRCWITKYAPLPDLDASSGGIGFQSVVLRHEGWERV